jgi:hypothetical protein
MVQVIIIRGEQKYLNIGRVYMGFRIYGSQITG